MVNPDLNQLSHRSTLAKLQEPGNKDLEAILENNNYDQEIYDSLIEAGYSIDEINEVIASRYLTKDSSLDSHKETSFFPLLPNLDISATSCGEVSVMSDDENPHYILKKLKEKNSERPIIAHLNINSISSKFEPLISMIKDSIDFLLVTESKLDDTFPKGQFQIEGYARPLRLDRTRNGGGLIVFVRDDLTCKELKPRVLYPEIECTFLEVRVRQSK